MTLDEIMDSLKENEMLLADGLEAGLIGMCAVTGRAVYDSEKCIEALMKSCECYYGEAREFFEYNTLRSVAYFGDKAPIFVDLAEVPDAADSTAV